MSAWFWVPRDGGPLPDTRTVGGKGRQLGALSNLAARHGSRVPRFVVLRTEAFERWADAGVGPNAASDLLPEPLASGLTTVLRESGLQEASLAVRSSATREDGSSASFAGQFDSVLSVPGNDPRRLHAAIRQVWASAAGARAVAYQAQQTGEADARIMMAVVLQEMVEPAAAGVGFAIDPVTGDLDSAVVSAVFGLGEGLVSGELDADSWHVAKGGSLRYTGAHKTHAVRSASGGGTVLTPLDPALAEAPVLSDAEAREVARTVRAISEELGAPQDIEWAITDEGGTRSLVLLQTRPVTTRPRATASAAPSAGVSYLPPPSADDPTGPGRRVWDNSNIIESYSGVTTPLTFSFARGVYEDVYRQFCRLMGVSEDLIAESHGVFAYMLGLVRGRVYYSLINWYRLIALLPGFEWNRSFMERMMGVREALEAPPPAPDSGSRMRDLFRLLRMLARMVREHGRLKHEVPAFHARVRGTLDPLKGQDLSTWDEQRIAALYRKLERELLQHWRPPLVNDFFAMIFFGVLGRLIERWLPDAPVTLGNDLLCGEGGIISTEPARRVMALARRAREEAAPAAAFAAEPDDAALWVRLGADPALTSFRAALDEYIEAFGDRCLEELKLETVTLREDPSFLIRMVRAYAGQGSIDPDAAREHERKIRREAEALVRGQLSGWRRPFFFWVLRGARARVRDRENLRFERTRVFGIVRRMVLGLGAAFTRDGRLREVREVFWLTTPEALAVAEGKRPATDLRELVAQRSVQFRAWQEELPPPDRFESTGPLGEWVGPREAEIPRPGIGAAREGDLTGTGCCPGVVRAPVRIVRDPREATNLTGRILVAERTDPGWTLLFPAAQGLLVQRGSLLSHSAIVAREMGLPCVVGIGGLLDTLTDGEVVEMDGTTGVVRRMTGERG
ncbi:MAG: phosphoenolpyruvate synthase [Candidatus Eisenbacteria bacterium]|nr:phosphoenolpyruvate synthase [Candidatus Eisenbacteria bacterium]